MQEYIRKIASLPLVYRIILSLVLVALVFGGFWQFIYEDVRIKQSSLVEEIETLENKILSQQKIAKNLNKYKVEVKELDLKLAGVLRELPDKKEVEGFLRSISVLAVDTGLEVLEFTPSREKKNEFFAQLPVKMKLEGNFHQLATFFDEVAHLPRIVNINAITINILTENEDEVIIRADCIATTFRYLDPEERDALAAKNNGDNKKKRRR